MGKKTKTKIPRLSGYQAVRGQWFTEEPYELNEIVRLRSLYGNIFRTKRKHIILAGAEGINHVLLHNARNYRKIAPKTAIAKALGWSLNYGARQDWQQERAILSRLTSMEHLQQSWPNLQKVLDDFCAELKAKIVAGEKIFKLDLLLRELSLRMLISLFLGINLDDPKLSADLVKHLSFINHYVAEPAAWPLWIPTVSNLRFKYHLNLADNILRKILAHTAIDSSPNLKTVLQEAILAQEIQALGSNFQFLMDEAKAMLFMPHEKVGSSMFWALCLLILDPDYANFVEDEIRILQGKFPQLDDLEQMLHLQLWLMETLRMYPPVWVLARQAVGSDKIEQYNIKAKSTVYCHIYALQRNTEHWPNPEVFDPWRFSKQDGDEEEESFLDQIYMPFGAGGRSCLANQLSFNLLSLAMVRLLQNFEFSFMPGFPIRLAASATIRAKPPVKIKLALRKER